MDCGPPASAPVLSVFRCPVSQRQIVIVEDEPSIRTGIAESLRLAGFQPIETADGEAGLAAARRPGVELVLLDLMLPKMEGMEVLRRIRQTDATLPVIILTARGHEDERVAGLRAGADDYVVKPFSARELTARVEAVLRRSPERPLAIKQLSIGDACVDLERREIRQREGDRQSLSETECSILLHLAAHAGRAISRDELLSRVWGLTGANIETRTIDMHIARLRSKLVSLCGGEGEDHVQTVRGKGYMLGAAVRIQAHPGGAGQVRGS